MQSYQNTALITRNGASGPWAGASCAVYLRGTLTLATIYSDNGITVTANPLTTSATGDIFFYAADGRYDLSVSQVGYATVSITDIILEDPRDTLTYVDTGIIASYVSSTAGYNQIVLQNSSAAVNASANFIAANNTTTATTNFAEFGINSSTFSGSGPFSVAGAGYLTSTSVDLSVGTVGANALRFGTNSVERLTISSTGAVTATGQATLNSGTAVPAGGAATAGLLLSSTAGLGVYFGSGVPTLSAAQGSLYMRTDGSTTATRMYINTNGTTGWTNVTTAT